jgi:5-methylcytosine-specific restriction enzyme subunit McrC
VSSPSISVRLGEWQRQGPDDPASPLRGVRLANGPARELAARLSAAGLVEILELADGVEVRSRAHVGRLQIGNIEITIEPKVGGAELLALLQYAYGLRNLRIIGSASFSGGADLLQDLLAAQLLQEASELVRRGLTKRYVARGEPLQSPRGRIQMLHAVKQMSVGSAHLQCRHYLRLTDHLLNRVVLAGIELGADVVTDLSLRRALRRLRERMATEVGPVALDSATLALARRSLDRLSIGYESLLALIDLLLAGRATALDDQPHLVLPGFLFDMNRFFQALMGRFLRENLRGLQVAEERGLSGMMRYLPEANPNRRRAPTPRPDFLVSDSGRVLALLDAKYRDLWLQDLPREMLYQLSIYALSQPRPFTAAILYPTTGSSAREAHVEISDPRSGEPIGYVALRPVQLRALANAVLNGSVLDRQDVAVALAGLKPGAGDAMRLVPI